jgi:hypothetical protein
MIGKHRRMRRVELCRPGRATSSVRGRTLLLVALLAIVSACDWLPATRNSKPPPECVVLPPETELIWAGRGDVVSLGLMPPGNDRRVADIYVGPADPPDDFGGGIVEGAPAYCAVYPDGVSLGPLPEGWQP